MTSKQNINANVEDVLVDIGVPALVLLSRNAGSGKSYYMASAIPDDFGDIDWYFVVSVQRYFLMRYLRSQCDLRFLYAFAPSRKYYRVESESIFKKKVALTLFDGELSEMLLPNGQFFASAHTSEYGVEQVSDGGQKLKIDGEWEMPEFTHFYQKYIDLYALECAKFEMLESEAAINHEKSYGKIEAAFRSKPFKGGSSYLNFFGDLMDIIPYHQRPMLEGIVYHSPGYVEMRGREEVFESMQASILNYLDFSEEIGVCHANLRKFMSSSKLLEIGGRSIQLTPEQTKELSSLVIALYECMNLIAIETVLQLTRQNLVVTGKIGLALYRRLSSAGGFFAQGRMAFEGQAD